MGFLKGFLSAFRGEDIDTENSGSSSAGVGMLRTVRNGGYNKASVLNAIDALNSEIFALTDAYEKKSKGESFTVPQPVLMPALDKVSAGGFNEDDIDAYIADMKASIAKLREQL